MYIPKSKIEANLYSSGELMVSSTKKVYYGPYFKTYDGILYSGKEPNDGVNLPLEPLPTESPNFPGIIDYRFTNKNSTYSNLVKAPKEYTLNIPISFTPQPTNEDYQTGEITRFFAKKHNENLYYEVANDIVSSNPMYLTFNLQWLISGEENQVREANHRMVDLYMRQLPIPNFNLFLKNNYLKFWKPS